MMRITKGETTVVIPGWLTLVGVIAVVDIATVIGNTIVATTGIKKK